MSISIWHPIRPLTLEEFQVDFAEIDALYGQWLEVKNNAERHSPNIYAEFNQKLDRRWAIETGIIEGLYQLDIGITQTLIENGIISDYIERSSTNKEPEELTAILKSHVNAIEFVNGWIKKSRPLTTFFLKTLHSSITEMQHTYSAIDQFGKRFETNLRRGEFKLFPNNPTRPDGSVYFYCPPEQVDSEIDNLISLYEEMQSNKEYHPLAVGAWLHHRFSQIHPFQDGNGRVGRALLTWHLVKEEYLPVVISRDNRLDYIGALEYADEGRLSKLINLLVRLEKETILRALNVVEPDDFIASDGASVIDQVVNRIVDRFNTRQHQKMLALQSVHQTAEQLRMVVEKYIEQSAEAVASRLRQQINLDININVLLGGPDRENGHWYRDQVLKTANQTHHWVNFSQPRYFVRLRMAETSNPQIPRMDFVISLHSVGKHLTGVMAATAFVQFQYPPNAEQDYESLIHDPVFETCSVDAFIFTWEDDVDKVAPRIEKWIEQCYGLAVKSWGDIIVENM